MDAIQEVGTHSKDNTKRQIGWFGAIILGPTAALMNIGWVGSCYQFQPYAVSFLIVFGWVVSLIATFGWTELILLKPNRVGGIASACIDAFYKINPVLGEIAAFGYWVSWAAMPAFL